MSLYIAGLVLILVGLLLPIFWPTNARREPLNELEILLISVGVLFILIRLVIDLKGAL